MFSLDKLECRGFITELMISLLLYERTGGVYEVVEIVVMGSSESMLGHGIF